MFRLAFISLLLMCGSALAQPQCFKGEDYKKRLPEVYQEQPLWKGGNAADTEWIEIWVSKDNTTWTIVTVATEPLRYCIVMAGQKWEFLAPPPDGDPA